MNFAEHAPAISEDHVQQWEIEPVVAAKNRVIEQVLKMLGDRVELGPSTLFKYRLCLDEALTNSITHGSRVGQLVRVDFYFCGSSWAVKILDQGPGFEKSEIPDPTAPGQEFVEHGRGILIMQRYCEDVVYSQGGRELTLRMKAEELTV